MNPVLKKFLDRFKEKHPNAELIFLYVAGSHFFDLNSPNSDFDYRGIFIPDPHAFKLNDENALYSAYNDETNTDGANSNEDIDLALTPLPSFLDLLKNGDFNMMEALYTPEDKIIIDSPLMKSMREDREKFLVNDIESFLGFFKKEYRRYGLNIYHNQHKINFVNFLKSIDNQHDKLKDNWDKIKEYANSENSGVEFSLSEVVKNQKKVPTVLIATIKFHDTTRVSHVVKELEKNLKNNKAGHRQEKMAETGKEFKGLYHAKRLMIEAKELLINNRLPIPLPTEEKELLRSIKDSKIEEKELFKIIEDSFVELQALKEKYNPDISFVQSRIEKLKNNLFTNMNLIHVKNDLNSTPNFPNAETFLVGGAVRDSLMNKVPNDKDYVIVGAKKEDIELLVSTGFKEVGNDFPVFLHPETQDEYALARVERKTGIGYHDFQFDTNDSVSLKEDLSRRDLTINAIAMNLSTKELIDPFNGLRDIKHKILNPVTEAFKEDPLRVLRAARFSALLGFTASPKLKEYMKEVAKSGELKSLAKERVNKELIKVIDSKKINKFFELLFETNCLQELFPEIHLAKKANDKLFAKTLNAFKNYSFQKASFRVKVVLLSFLVFENNGLSGVERFISNFKFSKNDYLFVIRLFNNFQNIKKLSTLSKKEILDVYKKLSIRSYYTLSEYNLVLKELKVDIDILFKVHEILSNIDYKNRLLGAEGKAIVSKKLEIELESLEKSL